MQQQGHHPPIILNLLISHPSLIDMSTACNHFEGFILLVLCILSVSASPPFAAQQIFLWPGNTRPLTMNTAHNYTCTLPTAYPLSYRRSLALSGFYVDNTFQVGFTANIVQSSISNEIVQIMVTQSTKVYQLSFYVVLVSQPQFWVWSIVNQFTPTWSQNQTATQLTQLSTVTVPQLSITNVSDLELLVMLVDYDVSAKNFEAYNMQVQVIPDQIVPPNSIYVRIRRPDIYRMINRVTYNAIVINSTFMTSQNAQAFYKTFQIEFVDLANYSLFDSLRTNFGIPDAYLHSTLANDHCVVGIFISKSVPTFAHQVFFNATTTPFHDMIVSLSSNSTLAYNFQLKYRIFCVAYLNPNCQIGFKYNRYRQCVCLMGWEVSGGCTNIPGCISVALSPDGSFRCLSCNSSLFASSPINGVCKCLSGTLANNICNNITGCVTPYLSADNQIKCLFCNSITKFYPSPTPNGVCQCLSHFKVENNVCIQICGDGFSMIPTPYSCDDGNLDNGDGCSSLCQVEPFYKCENGSSTSLSECIYWGNALQISVKSIKRNVSANQGFFNFIFSPSLPSLYKMDFSSRFYLNCDSAHSVSSVKYVNGELQLVVDYTKDMEGVLCNLTVNLNEKYIKKSQSVRIFKAVSNDIKLLLRTRLEAVRMARFNFKVLSYIILGIFALSLGHKMIGAELIVCCQAVYMSCSLFGRTNFVLDSFLSLNAVNGITFLQGEPQFHTLLSSLSENSQPFISLFIKNAALVAGVLSCTALFFVLLSAKYLHTSKKINKTESLILNASIAQNHLLKEPKAFLQQLKLLQSKIKRVLNFVYNSLLFPFTSAFLLPLQIALYVGNIKQQQTDQKLILLNSVAQSITTAIFGLVFAVEILNIVNGRRILDFIGFFQPVPSYYSLLFIIRTIIIALQITFIHSLSFSQLRYAVLIQNFLYLGLIILLRPYKSNFDNIGVILCQLTLFFGSLIGCIVIQIQFQEIIEICLIYFIQALVFLSTLISFIRILVYYIKKLKKLIQNFRNDEHDVKKQIKEDQLMFTNRANHFSLFKDIRLGTNTRISPKQSNLLVGLCEAVNPKKDDAQETESLRQIKQRIKKNNKRSKIKQQF